VILEVLQRGTRWRVVVLMCGEKEDCLVYLDRITDTFASDTRSSSSFFKLFLSVAASK
jgi:hypothetical protein